MKLIPLNPVEIAVGFCIQLPFYYIMGLWVFPLASISGLLWAWGGSGNLGGKAVRRVGVPVLSGLSLWAAMQSWVVLLGIPGGILACSLGYGQGSWLYMTALKINSNPKVADFITRMWTYLAYWVSFGIALSFV